MINSKITTSKTTFYVLLTFSIAFILISAFLIFNVQQIRASVEEKVYQISELSLVINQINKTEGIEEISDVKKRFDELSLSNEMAKGFKDQALAIFLNKSDDGKQLKILKGKIASEIGGLRKQLGENSVSLANYWWVSHIIIIISCVITIISTVLGYKIALVKSNIEHLKSSQKEYFELTNDAIMSSNADGDIVSVNQAALDLFGYGSKSELKNVGFHVLYANSEDFFSVLKSIKNTGSFKGEIENKKKNGERFTSYLSANAIKDESGKMIGTMGISRDVTAQVKKTEKLTESESNFRLINETLNDVFYLYNVTKQKYEYISSNCKEILGVDKDDVLNNKPNKYTVHPDDMDIVLEAKNTVESGKEYEIEYRIVVNDKVKWIREKSVPIKNKAGEVIKNSGVCRDITKDKTIFEQIQTKNKEINDSIAYAKNIQKAAVPNQKEIDRFFKKATVYHQAKDILSGDFYITSQIKTNDGTVMPVAVVADCTGHGIPGGILSLLCNALLKETFTNSKINSPSEALNYVRDRVTSLLNDNFESKSNVYDGMDVAFCVFSGDFKTLYFSSANIPCYLVKKNKELVHIKAERQHIGFNSNPSSFTTKTVELEKGDTLYITTDGYVDQFGGEKNKKFLRKRFKSEIVELSNLPIVEQKNQLKKTHLDWQGEEEQTDDITVMVIQID